MGEIFYLGIGQITVGDINHFVVIRFQFSAPQPDIQDNSHLPWFQFNLILYLERSIQDKLQSSQNIAQGVFHSQADGQTCDPDCGQEGADVDVPGTEDENHCQNDDNSF